MKKTKIGLALGGGAARGLAHIGVLKALVENNVPVDMIAGTSIGALVGACFAKDGEINTLEEIILNIDWRQLALLLDPNLALLKKGFIHGEKIKELLRSIIGDIEFKDLKIPLRVIATDVITGEEVVIDSGSVAEAVRASISIPVIFTPVKFENKFLVDGGIVNPVPVNIVRNMGAKLVIACNVIPEPQKRGHITSEVINKQPLTLPQHSRNHTINKSLAKLNSKIDKLIQANKDKLETVREFTSILKNKIYKGQQVDSNTPNIIDVLIHSFYIMEHKIAASNLKKADIIINPEVNHISTLEFHKGAEAISEGYKSVLDVLPKIKKKANIC
ncbi:patatin-like phospholipase family protein [bacterium]|nr:patatin-like phospholipase family protein [bacterium]